MEEYKRQRLKGLGLLQGSGLEIGAMHNPTPLSQECTMKYLDAMSRAEAITTFRELPPEQFKIEPDYIGDLDRGGLNQIPDGHFDFVILNHVIEHVANPVQVLFDLFRVVKEGGLVVISCPDKRFTFDKARELTAFEHLQREFQSRVDNVTEEHYLDFLRGVHPEVMTAPPEQLAAILGSVRQRREHAHVWDSQTFKGFLQCSMLLLGIRATCVYEVDGELNQFEYFSVWRLDSAPVKENIGSNDEDISAIDRLIIPHEFAEAKYLAANPDVAAAVARGEFLSGWQHYIRFGYAENRLGATLRE